jgi:metal-responsive CopG/Arc/MetJ family transcriptional regulator
MKRRIEDRKTKSKPILVWFPRSMVEGMNQAAGAMEFNRSRFIRAAVREKLNALLAAR